MFAKIAATIVKAVGLPLAKFLVGKIYAWLQEKKAERKAKIEIKKEIKKLKGSKTNEEIIAALRSLSI